jgi:hypothetical protein
MGGLKKHRKLFLLEEIPNRPYTIRVTYITSADNEIDCRDSLKMLVKLKAYLMQASRQTVKSIGQFNDLLDRSTYSSFKLSNQLEQIDSEELSISDDVDDESVQKFTIMEASNAKDFSNLDDEKDESKKKSDIEDIQTPQG